MKFSSSVATFCSPAVLGWVKSPGSVGTPARTSCSPKQGAAAWPPHQNSPWLLAFGPLAQR